MRQNMYAAAALGMDVSQPAVSKGFVDRYNTSDTYVPKSWFNDPYALLDSMGLGYKAVPSTLSFETLRAMSEKNVIVSAIIQTRINQVSAFCQPQRNKYSVGYKIMPKDRNKKLSDGDKHRIHELEWFIQNMGVDRNLDRDSLENFVKKIVRDRLRFDQVCAERVLRRNGRPHSVIAVPADTIRLAAPKTKKGTPLTPHELAHSVKYVQVVDGTIVNEYTRKEMIFRIANPRTEIQAYGYGYSELEMLINTITAHLWAEEWNRKVFSQGATVKGIINIKGNIAPNQLESFKRMWLTQVSGVTNAWKTPVLNSEGLEWQPLQPSNNDMGYQQWLEYLIKIACAVFLVDPSEINFDIRGGVGNNPMFMTTNESQQKLSKDRGLQPLVRFVQSLFNEEVMYDLDPNYELVFLGLDARTESEAIELRMKELQSYKTLNDIRREADDLPPVPGGDVVLNPVYVGLLQGQQQFQSQQQMMAAQGQQPPQGAQPPQAPGGAQPQQQPAQQGAQQVFPAAFSGGKGETKPLGAKLAEDAGIQAPKEAEDNSHSVSEVEEPWEETVHASTGKPDLVKGKAAIAFSLLE